MLMKNHNLGFFFVLSKQRFFYSKKQPLQIEWIGGWTLMAELYCESDVAVFSTINGYQNILLQIAH